MASCLFWFFHAFVLNFPVISAYHFVFIIYLITTILVQSTLFFMTYDVKLSLLYLPNQKLSM